MSCNRHLSRAWGATLAPFLYPCLDSTFTRAISGIQHSARSKRAWRVHRSTSQRLQSTAVQTNVEHHDYSQTNPTPTDFSSTPFADSCAVTVAAGAGGHGCISFLREKYIANGPPNGGDGGTGGSIYIQAVTGETSLHKLARRGTLRAERGRNGQGSLRGGARGEDVLITVPVGTVVREVWRQDLIEDEEGQQKGRGFGRDAREDTDDTSAPDQSRKWRRDKWLLYPGALPRNFTSADFPALPRPRRSNLAAAQPESPIQLDLDKPMDRPLLLAAGAMGGLGNTHFVTKSVPRPKYATKGESGIRINLQLELKLLADVGLVGLPNAGKSTLLRALTKSRTRVGSWAFTTLAPTIGTLVLDDYRGRPIIDARDTSDQRRTSLSIADIPGLIEDAHLDRGLGLGFLRHIERAGVLAFVVDLSAGDAVKALKGLWKEVGEYEKLREREVNSGTERRFGETETITYDPARFISSRNVENEDETHHDETEADETLLLQPQRRQLPALKLPPISSKPWFVVATKADLLETEENFRMLLQYIQRVQDLQEDHPCGNPNAWRKRLHAVPVSAMNKQGVGSIPAIIIDLMN